MARSKTNGVDKRYAPARQPVSQSASQLSHAINFILCITIFRRVNELRNLRAAQTANTQHSVLASFIQYNQEKLNQSTKAQSHYGISCCLCVRWGGWVHSLTHTHIVRRLRYRSSRFMHAQRGRLLHSNSTVRKFKSENSQMNNLIIS